jgi:membrane associated rhomboid family serine protease
VIFALPLYDDNPVQRTPVITFGLIGMCVGAYLWQLGLDEAAVAYLFGMIPVDLWSQLLGTWHPHRYTVIPPWATLFTSMFLHGGWLHLGGNMLFLWIFGNNIEDLLGRPRYLLLYLGSGVAAALFQAFTDPTSPLPMVGASGAVAGVLGAYLVVYPHANVHCFVWIVIFFWIVTVPAWIMLGLWFATQLFSGLASGAQSPGVAFWAHVGGFATGMFLLLLLRPRRVMLWHGARSPMFSAAPASTLNGRRTFHPGSVPPAGPPYPPPPGPWGRL